MKRLALSLLLILCLLGCSASEDIHAVCGDLSFTLPEGYIDLSTESYAADADFLYGREKLIILGLAEKKTALPGCTLETYTELVLEGNGLICTPEEINGSYRFAYEASAGDSVFTYVTGVYEGTDTFWIIQCYCPKGSLYPYQQEILTLLDSVQFQ